MMPKLKDSVTIGLLSVVSLVLTACNGPQLTANSTPSPNSELVTKTEEPASPWRTSTSKSEVTGEETTTASLSQSSVDKYAPNGRDFFGKEELVVRQTGHKLEFYFDAAVFMETLQNVDSGLSQVSYKFDDGPVVHQAWSMSKDYNALFYPGNPSAFLKSMAKAKRFAIEYRPADTVAQSISFDVSQFPIDMFKLSRSEKRPKPLESKDEDDK
jgi:hypothetical protein